MSDLNINEIANRIVDAVLNEPNFNKEKRNG